MSRQPSPSADSATDKPPLPMQSSDDAPETSGLLTTTSRKNGSTRRPREKVLRMSLVLYVAVLSVDVIRKATGLSTSAYGIIYIIVGLMYLFLLLGNTNKIRPAPRYLFLWLVLLSLWCFIEALVPHIPISMAILGWVSYVFFVPLLYIGAELMATDSSASRTLRIVAIAGAVVGLGAVVSAVLGQSAPAILQPIGSSAGVHSSSTGDIYLAPSIFATAEEAAEELLVALFAWIALGYLRSGRLRRTSSAAVGFLIAVGLFATERRADIAVAVAGILALIVLGRLRSRIRIRRYGPRIITRAFSRTAPALILGVIGSVALLSLLGAGKILPFLTSGSDGESALILMFSPADPGSLSGQGTGTSTQGAGVVGATPFISFRDNQLYAGYIQDGKAFITVEGGITKTWLELGIIGVAIYGAVFVSVIGPPIRSLRRLDSVGRALTVLAVALGIIFLKGHQSLDDPLVQPLFWLAAGGAWGRMRMLAAPPRQEPQTAERAVHTFVYARTSTPHTHRG
jgi:hypothetical protein